MPPGCSSSWESLLYKRTPLWVMKRAWGSVSENSKEGGVWMSSEVIFYDDHNLKVFVRKALPKFD